MQTVVHIKRSAVCMDKQWNLLQQDETYKK